MTAPTFTLGQPGADENDAVAGELAEFIRHAAANAPRSQQTAIGPSEVGAECDRRIAYKLLDWPKANTGSDPLASIIGTSFHAWAEAAFNRPELDGRFIVEQWLTIAPPLMPGGSCDLYDTLHDRVIDWKVVGDSSLRKYKSEGPRWQYVVQAHVYGLGWSFLGRTPKEVALAFIPRTGYLSGLWVWRASWDRQVALDALRRMYTIRDLIIAVDPEANPAMWSLIPDKPSWGCRFCPWFKPRSIDLGDGCPGNLPPRNPHTAQANTAA